MKRILVPTDFSPNSLRAIDYAVSMAKRNKGTIYLMHVCELADTTYRDRVEFRESYNQKIAADAFEKLETLRTSITETENVAVTVRLYDGIVADAVKTACEEFSIQLVIMGTMGRSGLREALFGSITASLIGYLDVPLLAIPLEAEGDIPSKVALAIQESAEAEPLLPVVEAFASIFSASVQLVHFNRNGEALFTVAGEPAPGHAMRNYLYQEMSVTLASHDEPAAHQLQKELMHFVKQEDIDVLAMITHERGILRSIFHPRFTRHMSYHLHIPLLVLPEKCSNHVLLK